MLPDDRRKVFGLSFFLLCLLYPTFALGMESEDCLGCHADADMVGEECFVSSAPFLNSAHADVGCSACHESISEEHPDDGLVPSRPNCLDCHYDMSEEYSQSAHSANTVCSDCHNPHKARGAKAVSGQDMNAMCVACHASDQVTGSHSEWLPQAKLHISMVPCVTCHTASKDVVISLYITHKRENSEAGGLDLADHAELATLAGSANVQDLVDTNQDDYISIAELRMFNRNPANKNVQLLGMMTPAQVSHDIMTLDNRWDCSFCHVSGPGAMQTSYVSLAQPDGSFKRVPAEQGAVLDALFGTPDFYMVGATRSKTMNYIGLAIISGGLVLPIGHGSLRILTRKNRRKSEDKS